MMFHFRLITLAYHFDHNLTDTIIFYWVHTIIIYWVYKIIFYWVHTIIFYWVHILIFSIQLKLSLCDRTMLNHVKNV